MPINSQSEKYIEALLPEKNEKIRAIEKYADAHRVPIMEQTGIHFLLQLLAIQKPKKILEIGTAIGYSAIRMAEAVPEAEIITLERDHERMQIAEENVENFSLNERIHLLFGDALEKVDNVANKGPYDCLFIDAAKGQYEKFFQLYEPHVSVGGLIICDNVLFKGMVTGENEIHTKRMRKMVEKIHLFNEQRMKDNRFQTMIYPIGDGVMVSYKIND